MARSETNPEISKDLYAICGRPDWVKERQVPTRVSSEHQAPSNYLLLDYQIHTDNDENSLFHRMAVSINDESCIEDLSQYLYELEPESEHLSIHCCTITRNNKKIDALDGDNIRSMQREAGLERHVSSDRLTVELIIDDLRVGDIINIETTKTQYRGKHPLYGHYIKQSLRATWSVAIGLQCISVTNNTNDKNLVAHQLDSAKSLDNKIIVKPGESHEDQWENTTPEAGYICEPTHFWPRCVLVTSESDWPAVSAHLHSFYLEQGVVNSPLDVSDIEELDLTKANEETILSCIRFVQDSIRYRSETNGIFTHTPKEPAKTLKRRTGDCKDKSNLLVTLLKVIGVEADLALVNTSLEDGIDMLVPSPFLFDHMIVRLTWQGKSYFIDATSQKQGGTLDKLEQLRYGKALILKNNGGDLVDVPFRNDFLVYDLKHKFDLRCENSTPTVEVTHTYHHNRANTMRFYFASSNMKTVEKDYLEALSEHLEITLKAIQPIHVLSDNLQENILVSKEVYQIETPLDEIENGALNVRTTFYSDLEVPATNTNPVELRLDGTREHNIEVIYDDEITSTTEAFKCESEWFNYEDEYSLNDNVANFRTKLSPGKSIIPIDKLDEHREHYKSLQNRSGNQFVTLNENNTALAAYFFGGTFVMLMMIAAVNGSVSYKAVIAVAIAVFFWISSKKKKD